MHPNVLSSFEKVV